MDRGGVTRIRPRLTLGAVVVWQGHITVEGDADLTALFRFEFLLVQFARVRVRED